MSRPIAFLVLLAGAVASLVLVAQPGTSAPGAVHRTSLPAARVLAPTAVVEVRPVTAAGVPAPGWTVRRLRGSVDCDGASPSAVDPGITRCYPTAYGLRACWRSTGHTVLCVGDARVRSLVRVRFRGRYPAVQAPDRATPLDLVLADGRTCLVRNGGAWSSPAQHPQWVGFDSCTRRASVYGPGAGDGIDRSRPTWRVRLWRTGPDPAGRHLVSRRVTTGYVVGNAPA